MKFKAEKKKDFNFQMGKAKEKKHNLAKTSLVLYFSSTLNP